MGEVMLIIILVVHWIADFICQTDKMAQNKSTSFKWLSSHVSVYTLIMMVFGWKYALTNGVLHLCIDFFTSRATSFLWKKNDRHNFFVVIGLDQLLHTACLILTMPLLWWSL